MHKYPYICVIIETNRQFTPTRIDYDNQMVWQQIGQASDNGEWHSFSEVTFINNSKFKPLAPQ